MPTLRKNARGRPQRQQRLRCRHCSLGVLALQAFSSLVSFAILAVVAIFYSFSPYAVRNGIPICLSSARPSASVRAVVVIEMFMPLVFSTLE